MNLNFKKKKKYQKTKHVSLWDKQIVPPPTRVIGWAYVVMLGFLNKQKHFKLFLLNSKN